MPERLKKFKDLSLRKQVAIFMTLAIVITSIAMSAVNYFVYRSHIKEIVEKDLIRTTKTKAEAFKGFINFQIERAALITSRTQMRENIINFQQGSITKFNFQNQTSKILNDALSNKISIHSITITDLNGSLLLSTSSTPKLNNLQQLTSNATEDIHFHLFPPTLQGENYQSQMVAPIQDFNNNPIAYALMEISLNEFESVIASSSQSIEQDFALLYSIDQENQNIRLLIPQVLPNGAGPIISFAETPRYLLPQNMDANLTVKYLQTQNGEDIIVSHDTLPYTDWIVMSASNKDFVFGAFNRRIGYIFLAILLITLLMIFFSYQFAFQIAIPLITMSNQAKEISKGNFNVTFYQKHNNEEDDPQDELAKSLNSMTQDMRKYIEFRDGFLSLAAHELKTPLSVIQSYLDLITIDDYRYQHNKDDFIKSVKRQCKLLNVLINDLLEVSRIQMGRFKLNKKRGDLSVIIADLVTELNSLEQKNKIILLNKVKKPILFDEERIEQVLLNLISNSIKFSAEGSEIFIQMEEIGPNIRVSVHDKGSGISKEKQELIFKQFAKDSQEILTPEKKSKSLGLSLYVCRSIIEKHNGSIWFESKENVGTSFYFELPSKEIEVLKSA